MNQAFEQPLRLAFLEATAIVQTLSGQLMHEGIVANARMRKALSPDCS